MTARPLRILVGSRAFDRMAGGVERMAIALMNEMAARGHIVTLVSWDAADAVPFYPLDPRIVWHKVAIGDPAIKASLHVRLQRAARTRKIARAARPDIMIGFQQGMFLALRLFTAGFGIPAIAAERNAPTRFDFQSEGKRRALIFRTLQLARRITIQSESYRTLYPAYLRPRLAVIPNPVFPATCQATPKVDEPVLELLCVGRLSDQKNQHALLEAFAQIATEFSAWRLTLVGEGPERALLQARIDRLGLAARVEMPGADADVARHYCRSHLFCLPSRWEGFPNALAEAMAHGLPVVGFAGCAGMPDLIADGETGLLAAGNGNAASLAAVLRRAMADGTLRARLGDAARTAMLPYRPAAIFDRWERLFTELARSAAARR